MLCTGYTPHRNMQQPIFTLLLFCWEFYCPGKHDFRYTSLVNWNRQLTRFHHNSRNNAILNWTVFHKYTSDRIVCEKLSDFISRCIVNDGGILSIVSFNSPGWRYPNQMQSHICNYRPRSQGDNTFGSVRPSVCPSVTTLKMSFFYWRGVVDSGTWLCQVQQKVQWNTNQVHS